MTIELDDIIWALQSDLYKIREFRKHGLPVVFYKEKLLSDMQFAERITHKKIAIHKNKVVVIDAD